MSKDLSGYSGIVSFGEKIDCSIYEKGNQNERGFIHKKLVGDLVLPYRSESQSGFSHQNLAGFDPQHVTSCDNVISRYARGSEVQYQHSKL